MRVLTARALNRATLARQHLLDRVDTPVVEAVGQVLGLNAQGMNHHYLSLWTRLADFTIDDLTSALEDGRVVRSCLLRGTQHIVTAADYDLLRPALTPLLRRQQRNIFGRRTTGIDPDELAAAAREHLADGRVHHRADLGRLLAQRWPDADATALGWSTQLLVPVIHPAPCGTWNTNGRTPFALADVGTDVDRAQIVRRYLAAFGPATTSDIRAWSGIAGLREVIESMRGELIVFETDSGRELFDLPDAPRPPADTPAPVRLLPEFDAPLLAFADRTRMMTDDIRRRVCVGDAIHPTVLVDGTVAATWSMQRAPGRVHIDIELFRPVDQAPIEAETRRLATFADPDGADVTVRFRTP